LKKYETTFIMDSLIKNEEIEGSITKIEKFISNNGGQIEAIERWGKKRLAYEIKKRQYGYYVHIIFDAPNKLNRLLDREYQLDENIIRYLTVLVDLRSEQTPAATIGNAPEEPVLAKLADGSAPLENTTESPVLSEDAPVDSNEAEPA